MEGGIDRYLCISCPSLAMFSRTVCHDLAHRVTKPDDRKRVEHSFDRIHRTRPLCLSTR